MTMEDMDRLEDYGRLWKPSPIEIDDSAIQKGDCPHQCFSARFVSKWMSQSGFGFGVSSFK
jgi:hypothetical protein